MIQVPHLDLNVVEHCNNRCAACSHASPLLKRWVMPLETARRDLLTLKPFFRCRNVHVVGGEPTLHPELVQILRVIKQVRLDERTVVITNGRLLPEMSEDFWRELEYLNLSVYPNLDPTIPGLAVSRSKEFGFGLGITEITEFYQQLDTVPDGSSFHNCPWKTDCYTVHDGCFYLCPQSTFFPQALMGLSATIDGLPLAGLNEAGLRAFMDRKQPFNACRTCRSYTKKIGWRESKTREQWIKDSTL